MATGSIVVPSVVPRGTSITTAVDDNNDASVQPFQHVNEVLQCLGKVFGKEDILNPTAELLNSDRVRPLLERLTVSQYKIFWELNRSQPKLIDTIAKGGIRFPQLTTTCTQLLEDLDHDKPSPSDVSSTTTTNPLLTWPTRS